MTRRRPLEASPEGDAAKSPKHHRIKATSFLTDLNQRGKSEKIG